MTLGGKAAVLSFLLKEKRLVTVQAINSQAVLYKTQRTSAAKP
jgi:hypothetical protein